MNIRIFLSALLPALFWISASAQVSGTVKDAATGEPLAGAVVGALSLPDSVVVDAAIADGDGAFVLKSIKAEVFAGVITVSCLGYESCEYSVQARLDAALTAQSTELQEVTVTASSLRVEAGKFVFTPGRISQALISAWDVFAYTPFISVRDQSISVVGKSNVVFHLNGRATDMSQDAIIRFLQNYSPDQITRIEINTSPGQEYGPSTCIINVVLKHPFHGLFLNASVNARYANEHLGGNVSAMAYTSKDTYRLSLTGGYRKGNQYTKSSDSYLFHNDSRTRLEYISNHLKYDNLYGTINFTFLPDEYTFTGIAANISAYNYLSDQSTEIVDDKMPHVGSTYYSRSKPLKDPRLNVSAFYERYFYDDYSSVLFAASGSTQKAAFTDNLYANGLCTNQTQLSEQNRNAQLFGRLKYYFSPYSSISSGYKFYVGEYKADNFQPDYLQQFKYTDSYHSAFINYLQTFNNTFGANAGIKCNWYHISNKTNYPGETNFTRNNFSIESNLTLSMNLPHNQAISLEYQQTVIQPKYTSVCPEVIQLSDNLFSQGNPGLKNTSSYEVNLNYYFLKRFTLSSSYTYSDDLIQQLQTTDEYNNVWRRFENIGYSQALWITLQYKQPLLNNSLLCCAEVLYRWSSYSLPENIKYLNTRNSKLDWNIDFYWTISRKSGWSSSLSFTPGTSISKPGEVFKRPAKLFVSITKQFSFGGKLKLSYSSLLNDNSLHYLYTDSYDYSYHNIGYNSVFSVSFSYTFVKGKPKKTISSEIDDSQSRYNHI